MDDVILTARIERRIMAALQKAQLTQYGRLARRTALLFIFAAGLFNFASPHGEVAAQAFSEQQHTQFEALIKDYILTHPEVIVESMER
ncbi:MAG: hypothetical protein JKY20_02930, partial [Alphaproteobacteria bacterium]|nr:hypothetical protein [Alphaproteobacteria bacterium]